MNHLLKTAITTHQNGKLEEAEILYREVLSTEPKQSDANHNLGLILTSKDKIEEALILFKVATEINPNIEQYWISYIDALIKQNRLEEAETTCKKILSQQPESIKLHFSLGVVLNNLDKLFEAEASYRKVIELKPDHIEAYNNLSIILNKLNRVEEAKEIFNKSLQLISDYNQKIALEKHQEAKKYCENVLKTKLTESPEKSSFVYREVSQRGFFLQSNLEKVDDWNKQLPLLTWPFLDFIKTLDLKDIILHELGAGSSTIWFSNKFKNIETIKNKIVKKEDLFDRNYDFKVLEIDKTFPDYIFKNKEELFDFIYK